MGVEKWPMAGEMTSRIEFFEKTVVKSASGTLVRADEPVSLGVFPAKRIDGNPKAEEDGRVLDVSEIRYQMRFAAELFDRGGDLTVKDFDGEYQVIGSPKVMTGRRRYMEIKCTQRG